MNTPLLISLKPLSNIVSFASMGAKGYPFSFNNFEEAAFEFEPLRGFGLQNQQSLEYMRFYMDAGADGLNYAQRGKPVARRPRFRKPAWNVDAGESYMRAIATKFSMLSLR